MTPEYTEYKRLKRELAKAISDSQVNEENLSKAKSKSSDIINRKQAEAAQMAEQEKNLAIKAATSDKEIELADLKKGLDSLKTEYDKDMAEITFENYKGNSSTEDILADVELHTQMLDEKLTNMYGAESYAELKSMVGTSENLDTDEILSMVNDYDIYSVKLDKGSGLPLQKISAGVGALAAGIEKAQKDADKRVVGIFLIAATILLVVGGYFIIPFYLLAVAVISIVGFYTSFDVINIIKVHKTILDNVDKVSEALNQDIVDMVESDRQAREERYSNDVKRVQKNIADCEAEIARITDEVCKQDFEVKTVDGSGIEMKIQQLEGAIQTDRDNLASLKLRVQTAEQSTKDSLLKLKEKLLGSEICGDTAVFPTDYLLDIETENDVRVEHVVLKPGTTLFLGDSKSLLIMFKLAITQLRSQMNPELMSYRVYDRAKAGSDYIFFVPKASDKNDLTPSYFRVLTTPEEFKDMVKEDVETLLSRNSLIKRECGNIAEYNYEMMKMKSVPADYKLTCIIGADTDVVNNQELSQLLLSGSEVGLITWVFTTEKELKSSGQNVNDFLDKFSNILIVTDAGVRFEAATVVANRFSRK